jgi:magnesium-transporting ATPase (P-type)
MQWQFKAVDIGSIVAPLLLTLNVYLSPKEGLWSFRLWFAWLSWLVYGLEVSTYVRGYLANLQGIQPEPRGKEPNLDRERQELIVWMVVCGFLLISVVPLNLTHGLRRGTHDWTLVLVFFAVLVLKLSVYARDSFWNAELT